MIIFDYATLADDSNRRHFIDPIYRNDCLRWVYESNKEKWIYREGYEDFETRKEFKPDWESYYAAFNDDKPIISTLNILEALLYEREGFPKEQVEIWCDLPEKCWPEIEDWLEHVIEIHLLKKVRHRGDGFNEPWHELKEKWLKDYMKWPPLSSLPGKTYARNDLPEMVFERSYSQAIKMWKRYGVPVMEVHYGD